MHASAPAVSAALAPGAPANALLVKLAARPDFAQVAAMPRGPERKAAAWAAITRTATESQRPLVALADRLVAEGAVAGYQLLVSPNMLVVTPARGRDQAVADAFRGAAGVHAIYANGSGLRLDPAGALATADPAQPSRGYDVLDEPATLVTAPAKRPYGVDMVGAPAAWARGADGAGLVFGSIDSGVDVTHPELVERYRGRLADGSYDHDYSWWDPTGSTFPWDPANHGTHTTGTAVGERVGIAPKAKFIAARGMTGLTDTTLRSMQWMLAPTRLDGSAPDPTKAPDVVGMSWWTGDASEDLFLESLQDMRAAGIVPVKSAGNRGPGAGSITSPGQHAEAVTVGAVDATGAVLRGSSRGPAPFPPGSTTPKPDLTAPGANVVSAFGGGYYAQLSGTSMAQPHVAGAILDILSAHPQLTDAQLDAVLAAGATDAGAPGPDADYGAGIVNVPASLDAAERITTTP